MSLACSNGEKHSSFFLQNTLQFTFGYEFDVETNLRSDFSHGSNFFVECKVMKFEFLQLANYLRQRGVKKGDRVCIYMPIVPELPIAMLACARIGAVHLV
jgi:long-subunit acyl-CoA synthetase (AMP-forming)